MAPEQTPAAGKFTKEEADGIKRALTMYENLTHDPVVKGLDARIQVSDPEKDKEAEAKRVQAEYDATAKLAARVEDTQQAERRARAAKDAGPDAVQDENPGPDSEAMVTERAKKAGVSRKGEEPPAAQPNR